MISVGIIDRPAFEIVGKKTWIDGPDNGLFGRFWQRSRSEGLFDVFNRIRQERGISIGPQTGGSMLGVSRVENDPTRRSFDYMIAIEAPADCLTGDLECFQVPAARWAVFECRGRVPDSIVASEIYAFSEWLPNSGYRHAFAPEMEVYPAGSDETYCEFWLPIEPKETV